VDGDGPPRTHHRVVSAHPSTGGLHSAARRRLVPHTGLWCCRPQTGFAVAIVHPLAPKTATCGRRRVKARSSDFAAQVLAAKRLLTSRFVVSCCPPGSAQLRPSTAHPGCERPVGLRSVLDSLSNLCSIL
jgi:hypothetical protein